MKRTTRIRLNDEVIILIERTNGKYKLTLDADLSLKMLTGDISAVVTRKDLIHARDSIAKILED